MVAAVAEALEMRGNYWALAFVVTGATSHQIGGCTPMINADEVNKYLGIADTWCAKRARRTVFTIKIGYLLQYAFE